ncbi:MAG: hypothetical protein NTW60_00300 [Candidatus Wolfebacteria bacterium]|nr:hypothetical protein [Candidatus Wolfebacteria bacterium]
MEIKEGGQPDYLEEEKNRRINNAYEGAISQHPVLKGIPEDGVRSFIGDVLGEIDSLEQVGERDKQEIHLSDEDAKKIAAIWVFSGPGTYDKSSKKDRYENYKWAENMDRNRLNYAARLAKRVAEANSGIPAEKTSLAELEGQKQRTKEKIRNYGPTIIYNGTPVENAVVEDVLEREEVIIPKEKVEIIEKSIDNTIDQIKSFRLPEGAKVKAFPLPTPEPGKEEYAEMEIKGILYYALVSQEKKASEEPYPYSVNEIQEDKDAARIQGNG